LPVEIELADYAGRNRLVVPLVDQLAWGWGRPPTRTRPPVEEGHSSSSFN
jgi:hypothetical protein